MARLPRVVVAILCLGILAVFCTAGPDPALAQANPPSGAIVPDGAAVATGFSGAEPPAVIAPGVDPADKTFIDLNGPSVRVIDIVAPGAAPQAQLIEATKPFTATAGQVGQVFAVALDDATPPNIYVAATSVYGLPIVVPPAGGGGGPARAQQGGPNAQFMPGLFGPQAQQGGPGSVWRIDGASGAVSLFASVTLEGVANSGPALGGLAFDPVTKSLFVADRETGMIHRFDMTGAERGRYDHGAQGRQAAGLPPLPFDSATRPNITSPQFRPADPQTWGYAPPPRRVFGLAVHEGRLYYAVADSLQIWSVSIAPNGAFGTDARIEITVPPGQGPSEIAKIAFDDQGRMLLAERAAPSGAADFVALTGQGGRVLRYSMGPPSPTGPGWTSDEYAVGFASASSGNGGVAVGYGYDPGGRLDRNACGGFVWISGEQLRVAADSTIAAQLALGGSPNVNGLQGNSIDAVRPINAPPLQSYFVDFDDLFADADARGHMGDVAILRRCAGGPAPAPGPGGPGGPGGPPPGPPLEEPFGPGPGLLIELWPDWPYPPPPACPIGTHPEPKGVQCCPAGEIPSVGGACTSACGNGDTDPAHQALCYHGFMPTGGPAPGNPGTCWNGSTAVHLTATPPCNVPGPLLWSPVCNKCPKAPLKQCPSGQHFVAGGPPPQPGWDWSNGHCEPIGAIFCLAGQQPNMDGVCQALCPAGQTAYPVNRCCVNGTHVNALGQCPGVIAPPQWYLEYLATGSGPCQLPSGNCSYYEFTITGRQSFGRGSLTQRITLPEGANFSEARITRGSKYCPASAWSCSKSGNGFTCSAEDCGLSPGDQVVLHLEGTVAAGLTEPPPTTIERTACGMLEWQALAGPGRVTMVQPGAAAAGAERQPATKPGADISRLLGTPSRQACWTIQILGRTSQPTCARNYVPTPDGQCCLASQMTRRGVCCPAGLRPDARGEQCVGQFVPVIPLRQTCGADQTGVWPNCCPLGRYWNGRECIATRGCPPDSIGSPPQCRCRPPLVGIPGSCVERPCPAGEHRVGRTCVPDLVIAPCPPGRHRVGRICVADEIICPPGKHRVGRTCVPDLVVAPCPPGRHRVGRICVADQIICPPGQHRIGRTCVPSRPEFRRPPPQRQPKPQPDRFRARPLGTGPY